MLKKIFATGFIVCVAFFATFFMGEAVKAADINNIAAPTFKVAKNMAGTDAFVYAYNVLDYGADNSGTMDNTEIFQKLLNKAGSLGGGIVYVPSGKYKVTGSLRVPKGVTLRGDWREPVKGQSLDYGTILMAYTGRNGGEKTQPFIEAEPETGVTNFTVWYPEQSADNIVPYSPTIRIGVNNYFGNEYVNVKDVTLVNSYIGVWYNQDNFGASPVVNGVYGTPLKKGVEIDCIADVGRIDRVNFSPDYWSGSNLPGAPLKGSSFQNYIYNNATGVVMRRNDWSYTCLVNVDGYNIGYNTNFSNDGNRSTPNGHHYKYNLTNCKNGIVFDTSNYVGILFDEIKIYNCENGIVVKGGTSDAVQFAKADITCTKYSVNVDKTSTTKVMMTDSTIHKGLVNMDGGTFISTNNTFDNKVPQIVIGSLGRVSLTGNKFNKEKTIVNNSVYKSNLNNAPSSASAVPEFDMSKALFQSHMPANTNLYVVTEAPYNANMSFNHGGGADCTDAINRALQDAGKNGGGIVFLPSGHYRVNGTLLVPSNVELRGATDVSAVPHGSGAILESYANKDNANGTPFIRLEANAGIRGVIINYPEQTYALSGDGKYYAHDYPYAIQGMGANVYIINTGIRAASRGVDLATYRCDNHYIDFLAGHIAHQCVKVGNGSKNGIINNLMFNTLVYACGRESKFGSFPNSPDGDSGPVYDQQLRELEFLTLGDCEGESLYNCFPYGAYIGIKLVNEGQGGPNNLFSMGLGIDGSRKAMYFDSGLTGKMDFVDNQIVSLNNDQPITRYIEAKSDSNFTANLYNTDLWGFPEKAIVMDGNSGTLNVHNANFQMRGYNTSLDIAQGSDVNLYSTNFNSYNGAFLNGDGNVRMDNVVADFNNNERNKMQSIVAGFSSAIEIDANSSASSAINRTGWKASASTFNENAWQSLDGNLESQWTTMNAQVPGQWYQVDMGREVEFDTIVTTLGRSGDVPRGYKVLLSNNGSDWREVASGQNQNIYSVGDQKARYVRIEQTMNESHWWAVYEFYVLKSTVYDIGEGEPIEPTTEATTAPTTQAQTTAQTTTEATTMPIDDVLPQPFGLVAGSPRDNVLNVVWGNAGNYVYNVYIDGALKLASVGCASYDIEGIPAGQHRVTVTITAGGKESVGTETTVDVKGVVVTTTQEQTTVAPTTTKQATTVAPTTKQPTTVAPTTTKQPTTVAPTTTKQATTVAQTTTKQATTEPSTDKPSESAIGGPSESVTNNQVAEPTKAEEPTAYSQKDLPGIHKKSLKKIKVKYKKYKKKYTKLKWRKIKGAKKYTIYVSKNKKKFRKSTTTKKLFFVHKKSKGRRKKCRYYIVARDKNGVIIAKSKIIKIKK